MRSLALVLLIATAMRVDAAAQGPGSTSSDSLRVQRLVGLGMLWGTVDYFHPALAYRAIDWDSAFAATAPKVGGESTPEEYAGIVQRMLEVLGDPVTRVLPPEPSHAVDPKLLGRWTRDSLLVVTVAPFPVSGDAPAGSEAIVADLARARGVVFDLQATPAPGSGADIGPLLAARGDGRASKIVMPRTRVRTHLGFPAEGLRRGSRSSYQSTWQLAGGDTISVTVDERRVPILFLLRRGMDVPALAVALQAAGMAQIVAEGPVSDAAIVPTHRMQLPGGIAVCIRTGEVISSNATSAVRADTTLPAPASPREQQLALDVALERLRRSRNGMGHRPNSGVPPPSEPGKIAPRSRRYPSAELPPLGYRILAAARIWTTIHYFFPYRDLMQEDWDATFAATIPRLEAARDSIQYNLGLAEMCTRIHDSHVRIQSTAMGAYIGIARPPLRVCLIENVPIVTEVFEAVGPAAAIVVGDEILTVDGERCADRIARVSKYISASTPQAMRNLTFWWMVQQPDGSAQYLPLSWLVGGPEGSVAKLAIRGKAGQVKDVELARSRAYTERALHQRSGDILRLLPGNIGYADLDRLQPSMVDEMFERFRDAKAIVFDVRGYPQGTMGAIAPRLTEASAPVAALFRMPVLSSPDPALATVRDWSQPLPATDKWRYAGKTFLLVDERTRSQGEHTGLFLETANGTPFVGGSTDGANGDVTDFIVPGGVCISFTGREVRHADGRQLQRVGLQPRYPVEPTIAGIRAGRDEVLEKAIDLAR